MASVKLNSHRNESRSKKLKRKLILKREVSRGKNGLKPDKYLNKFGRDMFKAIVENNKQLNSSDNASLNMLCSEYQIYLKMVDWIQRNGVIASNGKKAPQYSVLKQTIDTILKLEAQLDITPKTRIANEMDDQDNGDPLKQAVEDGDNE